VQNHPSSDETLAALYWAGRSLQQAGDLTVARTRWRSVIERDPLSYYALLASRRLDEAPWAPPAAADSFPSDSTVIAGMRRAALLTHLGMDVEAKHEYDALAADAGQSTERLLATAVAFRDRGLTSRAITLGMRALARGAPRNASLYRLLYPVTNDSVLRQEAARYKLDAALVAALIRQESNFEPRATSAPGARGLMQIMPAVGAQLARTRKLPLWDPELLYQPDLNIELGIGHLAGLLGRYDELAHALAAYNAGPTPVRRWLAKKGVSDPEMFVERIPYGETRDYVRIVTRNRETYRSLYGW
jgi:soluble lytic murein transglycosylase